MAPSCRHMGRNCLRMTKEELMQLAAEKAACELSRESIDYLFQPLTYLELLLRIDFEGTLEICQKAIREERATLSDIAMIERAIECEKFYQKIKALLNG